MKHILWAFALIGSTFLCDRLGAALLHQLVDNSQFRYSRLYKGDAGADIVFIGNSRGIGFYSPYVKELTGHSSFNLSYNALPMDLASILFRDYLKRNPAPKKLVIDVSMCIKIDKQLVMGFGCYTPYSKELAELITSYDLKMGVAGEVINLVRYNSEIFHRSLYYLNRSDETWLTDRVISSRMLATLPSKKPYGLYVVSPKILKDLVNTVKLAQSKGTTVYLVVNPYQPDFAKKLAHLQPFKDEISSATGLKVADYTNALQGNENFADYLHINKKGSYKYMSLLKKDAIL